jgi:small subunit ribosomal protein S6
MPHYEAAYYLLPSLEEGTVQTLNEKFTSHVSQLGGEVIKLNPHGKRKLAYPIKGQEEGNFMVLEFKGEPNVAKELGRIMRITDEVLRCMIVRVN